MTKIAFLYAEDSTIEMLIENILEYQKENNIIVQIESYNNNQLFLDIFECQFDIIFLEIKINSSSGFEIAKAIRKKDKLVYLFYLASSPRYALEGYKVNAANYLLLPLNYIKFESEINKVINKSISKDLYIVVSNDNGKYKILYSEIIYVETMGRNTIIHTIQSDIISHMNMKTQAREFDNNIFIRIHHSYLVNMYAIHNIEKTSINLINDQVLPISRRRKSLCIKVWMNFLNENNVRLNNG